MFRIELRCISMDRGIRREEGHDTTQSPEGAASRRARRRPGPSTDYETASGFWQGRVRHVGVLSKGANGYVNRKFNYSSLNRRN